MTTSRVRPQLSDDADLLLDSLRDIVGETYVLDPATVPGYVTDWAGRWEAEALAVVRPGSAKEVAAVLDVCRRANVTIIPHGRITGRVGGRVPAHGSVVLSTRRLNHIEKYLRCTTA